jgi:nicotinamide riboside transporter PnuC
MTAAKQIEYAIARRLIRRGSSQSEAAGQPARQPWVDRMIAVLAATAGLAVVGSYAEELLWLVVAVATVITLK